MENWYLIQSKPRKEELATNYLREKGIEIYFPMMEQVVTRNGAFAKTVKPLFPSYIFGKFDVNEKYSLVQWGHGVREIVSFGSYPLPVPFQIIETIKGRANGGSIIKKARRFRKGDQVAITAGPFRNITGIFEHWISDTERICILLNCIGYGARVDVHYSLAEHI
jgi:transcriptional antiterminator RfaH